MLRKLTMVLWLKGRPWKFGVCAREMAIQVAMLKMGQGWRWRN